MSRREPGYRPEPKLFRITFTTYPGLIVRARSTSTGVFMSIADLAGKDPTPDESRQLIRSFADVLVSWNLEYAEDGPWDEAAGARAWIEGDPVPTTYEGLITQDFDMVNTMVLGWMEAAAGVSAPLVQPSTSGSPSLVESLPMDVRSPSLAS